MRLHLLFDQEADGRWLCEIEELPGVLAYGATIRDAERAGIVLALRTIADRVEHGEMPAPVEVLFV